VLEAQFPPTHSVYSSREGTVASFTAVVRKRRAWFTAVVRELWLDLQQSIDSQLSMLVIVLYLIRTGSNLYSWGRLFLSLKHKVAVCDHKNIACYQERTAKTSLNSKGTLDTKKQQFDRKIQAFAGYFRVNTGRVQPLQIPVSH
jgi:hypothetical protein